MTKDDAHLVGDLSRTAAKEALALIVRRAQVLDDGRQQSAILVAAIAMLAGTVRGALLDKKGQELSKSSRRLWDDVFTVSRDRPMMQVEISTRPGTPS